MFSIGNRNLGYNHLTGSIPSEIGNLINLNFLFIKYCFIYDYINIFDFKLSK